MNSTGTELRWTSGWVVLISFLTPASVWALHSVMPEMVAWYLGVMGWLILTPEKRPQWFRLTLSPRQISSETVVEQVDREKSGVSAANGIISPDETLGELSQSVNLNGENGNGKSKKPRSRARKPKPVSLAEMKSLTSSADRAVVWSQVGPGKFVRQAGEEAAEGESETGTDGNLVDLTRPTVIEAVVSKSTVLDGNGEGDLLDTVNG